MLATQFNAFFLFSWMFFFWSQWSTPGWPQPGVLHEWCLALSWHLGWDSDSCGLPHTIMISVLCTAKCCPAKEKYCWVCTHCSVQWNRAKLSVPNAKLSKVANVFKTAFQERENHLIWVSKNRCADLLSSFPTFPVQRTLGAVVHLHKVFWQTCPRSVKQSSNGDSAH